MLIGLLLIRTTCPLFPIIVGRHPRVTIGLWPTLLNSLSSVDRPVLVRGRRNMFVLLPLQSGPRTTLLRWVWNLWTVLVLWVTTAGGASLGKLSITSPLGEPCI